MPNTAMDPGAQPVGTESNYGPIVHGPVPASRPRVRWGRRRGAWWLVSTAVFSVLLMVVPTGLNLSIGGSPGPPSLAGAGSGSDGGNASVSYPYLVSPGLYPAATPIGFSFQATSLPREVILVGANTSEIGLAFVSTDSNNNAYLEFETGSYSPAFANASAAGCPNDCGGGAPIQWSAPIMLHSFGTAGVSSDAAAASGEAVVVAAASAGSTSVFGSFSLGVNNTWVSLTGSTPISGSAAQVTITPCGVLVTTITSSTTYATTFPFNCHAYPSANPPSGYEGMVQPLTSTPTVTLVTPNFGNSGTSVQIQGSNFEASQLVVYFENGASKWAATQVQWQSPDLIVATAPSGPPGRVPLDIVVSDSGGTSSKGPPDEFFYSPCPVPTVTGVSPSSGPVGTFVNITGSGFLWNGAPQESVNFGANSSSDVIYLNATHLEALVPWALGTPTVDVRVATIGGTSATSSADHYRYTPGTRPTVTSIWPTWGPVGTRVQINGTGFTSTASVRFGRNTSTQVTFTSTSQLTAVAPTGFGSVDVLVNSTGLTSSANRGDLFSYPAPLPGNFARITASLPAAKSASPVWSTSVGGQNGTLAIFASLVNTKEFTVYVSQNEFASYNGTSLFPLNFTSGSPYFQAVGDTNLETPGGLTGLTAAAAQSAYLTGFVTDQEQNRSVLRSIGSSNGGASWGAAYESEAPLGSYVSIQDSVSPAGYIYVAALDTGAGGNELEQAIFSASGRPLQSPVLVPQTTGGGVSALTSATVAVDPLQRPVYVWGAWNSTTERPNLYLTGDFPTPYDATLYLKTTFDSIPADDLQQVSQTKITAFRGQVDANLSSAMNDLARGGEECLAERNITQGVYPRLTTLPVPPASTYSNGCSASVGSGTSYLSPLVGALSANTTLSVLGEGVLESFGYGTFPAPAWPGTPMTGAFAVNPLGGQANIPLGTRGVGVNTKWSDWLWVYPETINPTAVELVPLLGFSSYAYGKLYFSPSSNCTAYGSGYGCKSLTGDFNGTWISGWVASLTFNGHTQLYSSGSPWAPFYLTNLTSNSTGSWSYKLTATFEETETFYANSVVTRTQSVSPVNVGPSNVSVWANGTYSTYFGSIPASPIVHYTKSGSNYVITAAWNNSMYANGTAALTAPSRVQRVALGVPALSESTNFTTSATAGSYVVYANLTNEKGGRNSSWTPVLNAGSNSNTPPWTVYSSCSFTISSTAPVTVSLPANYQTNVTGTDSTLTWTATSGTSGWSGTGWIKYREAFGPIYEETAQATKLTSQTWQYQVHLHGLTPWGYYYAQVGVSVEPTGSTCLIYDGTASTTFQTTNVPQLAEYDRSYDSVTKEGGGAVVSFDLPSNVVQHGSAFSLFVTYYNASLPANVTALSLSAGEFSVTGPAVSFNLSALQPNTLYDLQLEFNYTYGGVGLTAQNTSFSFHYLKDTSGDGLTDAEKVQGWQVVTRPIGGAWQNRSVTADPARYATNGLVNDYLEKEFGLNPDTLDSAGSHMLDTWNLTFDLGPGTPALPSGSFFQYYYENSSYNFSKACQEYAAPGSGCSLSDRGGSLYSNLSAVSPSQTGDSNPWAASVRWSGTGVASALTTLESLMTNDGVSWLRATTGTWGNDRTITVWGKLSWGANPLVQSTRGDGLFDGDQPDPLAREAVQFSLSSWWANLNGASDEGAPFLTVSGGVNGTSTPYYDGYGPAEGDNGNSNVSYTGPYVITVPVTTSNQRVYYNLSINDNQSSGRHTLLHPLNGSGSIDLVGALTGSLNVSQRNASLTGTYQVLRVAEESTTLLWVPANNTTLSNLPWGLDRYTAEPDFDLIVLNLSAQTTISGITGAEGGYSYSVTLSAGLDNLLVPRGAFLNSPLGQALVNNTNESVQGPMGSGVTFTPWAWSDRTESSGSNSPGNPDFIWVFSNTSQSQNGSGSGAFGGLPQNGVVESGYESRQVQAVFWVNVTTNGNFSSNASEIEDLFGGLVLNSTGNMTGNLESVAPELGTLGLPSNVLSALANKTLRNDGSYAPPVWQQPPGQHNHKSFWQALGNFGSDIWNTLSGVAEVTGLTKVLSVVWNNLQASGAYIGNALTTLSNEVGLTRLASQLAAGLKVLASAMEWAWNQFVQWLIHHVIDPPLNSVVGPILSAAAGFDSSNAAAGNRTILDIQTNGSVSPKDGLAWAHSMDTAGLLGDGLGTALVVALTLLLPIGLEASFLIGIFLGLLPAFAQNAFPSGAGDITVLTSQAVLSFGSHFSSIPTTTWEAVAGSVAIGAAGSDLVLSNIALVLKAKGAASGFAALAVLISTIVDIIVLAITIIDWAPSLPILEATALVFAGIGLASALLLGGFISKQLGAAYAEVALILAGIGVGAAAADYYLHNG